MKLLLFSDHRELTDELRPVLAAEFPGAELQTRAELNFDTALAQPANFSAIFVDLGDAPDPARALERCLAAGADPGRPLIALAHNASTAAIRAAFEGGAWDFCARGPALAIELPARLARTLVRVTDEAKRSALELELRAATRQWRAATQVFRRASIRDDLTGVFNRRFYDRYLTLKWRECAEHMRPMAILMIDVDYFKKYNDHYGHQAGDACLTSVARALDEALRDDGAVFARIGGEEFSAIIPEADSTRARKIGERLRLTVANLNLKHEASEVGPHVTIGVGGAATLPGLLERPSDLIRKADRALYRSKDDGRNRVTL